MMMMTMMMMTINNYDNSNNNDEKCNYQANLSGVVYLSMRFLIKMFKQAFNTVKTHPACPALPDSDFYIF